MILGRCEPYEMIQILKLSQNAELGVMRKGIILLLDPVHMGIISTLLSMTNFMIRKLLELIWTATSLNEKAYLPTGFLEDFVGIPL